MIQVNFLQRKQYLKQTKENQGVNHVLKKIATNDSYWENERHFLNSCWYGGGGRYKFLSRSKK